MHLCENEGYGTCDDEEVSITRKPKNYKPTRFKVNISHHFCLRFLSETVAILIEKSSLMGLYFLTVFRSKRFLVVGEKRRSGNMTNEQTILISRLMKDGMGYRKIAAELDLPVNSVKSWCRRHPREEGDANHCMMCGKEISSTPHKRVRKFCSDKCRYAWWSAHPEKRKNKTGYKHICF